MVRIGLWFAIGSKAGGGFAVGFVFLNEQNSVSVKGCKVVPNAHVNKNKVN